MRSGDAVTIEADDPIAPTELEALARQQGWTFTAKGPHLFTIGRSPQPMAITA